jgi:hypothetical protein
MEIVWIFIGNRMDFYGYSIEIVWIYYGFNSAIANFVVWILHFFPCEPLAVSQTLRKYEQNVSTQIARAPCKQTSTRP